MEGAVYPVQGTSTDDLSGGGGGGGVGGGGEHPDPVPDGGGVLSTMDGWLGMSTTP